MSQTEEEKTEAFIEFLAKDVRRRMEAIAKTILGEAQISEDQSPPEDISGEDDIKVNEEVAWLH